MWLFVLFVALLAFLAKTYLLDPLIEYRRLVGQQGVSVSPAARFWPVIGDVLSLVKAPIKDENGRHLYTNILSAYH